MRPESYSCVKFRIGEVHCLTLTLSSCVEAIVELPQRLTIIPGTKPYLLGASFFGRKLVPHIHLASLLNISTDLSGQGALMIVRTPNGQGMCGLYVEEIIGFSPANIYTDVSDPTIKIPAALGSALCKVLSDAEREWALIDIQALISEQNLQNIELS